MRIVGIGCVIVSACTSTAPAGTVRVEIPIPINGFSSASVTFKGPDGARIMETTEAGWWMAQVPPGGSVDMIARDGSSPSSIGHSEWSVVDVQPGDVFPLDAGALPLDCTCRVMTVTSDGAGNYSWTDPGSVSARLITIINPFLGMGVDFGASTQVDRDPATSVHELISAPQELHVRVISCATSRWDDIRTKLGVAAPDCRLLAPGA